MRHKLVQRIVEAYKHAEETGTARKAMTVSVEVDNRSGVQVDEQAAAELARRVLAAEGRRKASSGSRSSRRRRAARSSATTSASTRRPTCSRSRSTGETSCRRDCRALGDLVLCPQVVGTAWRGPLVHGLLHLLGYEHGAEMEARGGAAELETDTVAPRVVQLRLPGDHPRPPTQRNLRIHFVVAVLVLLVALYSGVDRLELIALLLAIAFVLIAEMLNTAVEAAVDVATTPSTRWRSSPRTSPPAPS